MTKLRALFSRDVRLAALTFPLSVHSQDTILAVTQASTEGGSEECVWVPGTRGGDPARLDSPAGEKWHRHGCSVCLLCERAGREKGRMS